MSRPGFPFSTRFRVRYSEIDGQKIVFNSRYLEYADVGLTEFWRWADLARLGPEWMEAEFNVVRAQVEYKRPFRFDDLVEVFVRVERLGNSSMTMRADLCHAETGDLHAEVELVSVHLDLDTRRPKPIPEAVRAALLAIGA
ncbi:acyl-CoA thioesterase [Sphingomonas sp. ABOLD]|uniref:Acyl-CoA thioester hydrolase n=1 Tax=Sphingomonas trueperi TaxID=53317 RepID=A0A7X5XUY0_9SPHN|nr:MULTISPECIES: thioesterase family protein [Sphingomonas]NJB95774.1 acyl-CoA thioester hydrolase [Sphingomonas trueperi]RSV39425.1 acyl-CoA thioesterase [Sphingomonas sp. ABOLE]RSV49193.1 acyl-CoA thioesterase [Sphingomonas sp. ABOLD]